MPSLNRIYGSIQYQGTDGATAEVWLTAYVTTHAGDIRSYAGNGHNLTTLVPPHAEGCLTQLALEYHFETATLQDFQAIYADIDGAIYQGGVATADCDSSFGSNNED